MFATFLNRTSVSILQRLEPETAHNVAIAALKLGLVPAPPPVTDSILHTQVWGLKFSNPIGLAAGFDKNCAALEGLKRLGFGFVEVGTVTPLAQSGNPKPRIFRLADDRAIINRLGFNNEGLKPFVERLRLRDQNSPVIVGANVGANKDASDRIEDYVSGVRACAPFADYLTINVSSPNTPGLRNLQSTEHLGEILSRVIEARRQVGEENKPILLKIAPDLGPAEIESIAEFSLAHQVDGLIATNTTIARPDTLCDPQRMEAGGLSGKPLVTQSNAVLSQLYKSTRGQIPIVGVGGVSSAEEAYTKIKLGASLVQVYSAFVYDGPGLIPSIANSLAKLLQNDGFASVAEAVGVQAA